MVLFVGFFCSGVKIAIMRFNLFHQCVCVYKCFTVMFQRHYENTPIQIYRKVHLQKQKHIRYKNSYNFQISAQNIDYGYSLEPPRRGGSNEYPQSML